MLTNDQLEGFQALYQKRFGGQLSHEEAVRQASSILNLMRVIYKPSLEDKINNADKVLILKGGALWCTQF